MPAAQSPESSDPVEFGWIGDIVRLNLDENARGRVFVHEGEERDWTEFDARIRHAATGIRSDLLKRGQHIAVLARNHPVHFEALFAAANMGLVCTFVDWRLQPQQIARALNESEARILFVSDEFLELVEDSMMEISSVVSTITVGGSEDEYEEWLETHETHEALLRAAREVAASSGRGEEPVLRLYSSTGKKGPTRGEYTHRALLASASETLRRKSLSRGDIEALDSPVTVHEAVVRALANMSAGAATVLVREE
jgi:acyl-CoA synthetase (AMP-forming)/AMP-acid ligase II